MYVLEVTEEELRSIFTFYNMFVKDYGYENMTEADRSVYRHVKDVLDD